MNLDYHYWTFPDAVSEEKRNTILTGLQDKQFEEGLISRDGGIVEDKKKRNNSVTFLYDQFSKDIFIPYINGSNKSSGWNYDIDWLEDVQVSKYGIDKHYGWHHDAIKFSHDNEKGHHINYKGKERKLTALTLLSDDFSGGEFELAHQILGTNNNTEIEVLPVDLPLGTILVFPSFLWHRVKPVTSGIRHSMQLWCLGPPFK